MLIRKDGVTTSVTIFPFLVAISANLILYNKRDVKSWHSVGLINVNIMAMIINKTTLMMMTITKTSYNADDANNDNGDKNDGE